jgi:hypothetical protein
MTQIEEKSVKILFRFYSNVLDEWTVETLWAEVVDEEKGLYKLDNIPFYAAVACNDIVFAEFDEAEQQLTYRETVEYSGNSTIQAIVMDEETDINEIRDMFNTLSVESEKLGDKYFVINVPADIDYKPIKEKLKELQKKEILDYAEPCLSENHWYE